MLSGAGSPVLPRGSRCKRCVPRSVLDPALAFLDQGEREAIALAEELHADQLLLDDADARREAARRNLPFIGTLGVLREAARRELLDLRVVLVQLQETSFLWIPS